MGMNQVSWGDSFYLPFLEVTVESAHMQLYRKNSVKRP
jgi:hypothetical protein